MVVLSIGDKLIARLKKIIMMFYTIGASGDEDGNIVGYKFDDYATSKIEFDEGKRLYPQSNTTVRDKEKEPTGIIKLNIKAGRENAPLPNFLSQPKPIMSKKLLEVIRAAGVNNIDAYKADFYYADGSKAPGEYFIVNVIGVVAAADMSKSVYDPNQPDKMIAMSFDSLTIDQSKTHGLLMFRLAENIVEIILHEKVKKAIEKANIPYVALYPTDQVAIL